MRVLQVTPYYAPAWAYGGPPRVMSDFASGLAARGHEVDVLTTDVLDDERRATPREEVLDGVRVLRLPNLSNTLAWRTKKYLPRGLVRRLAVEAPRYDVVHVTDVRTYLTASAFLATTARRTPLALSAHGSLPGSSGLRGRVKTSTTRRSCARCSVGPRSSSPRRRTRRGSTSSSAAGRRRSSSYRCRCRPSTSSTHRAAGSFRESIGVSARRRRCCSSSDGSTG